MNTLRGDAPSGAPRSFKPGERHIMWSVHHYWGSGSTIGIAMLCAVAAIDAAAQPADSAAQTGRFLEEVIVTARKREEGSQDIPLAVTVFGQDELERRKVLTVLDLQSIVPNLVIDPINFQSGGAAVFVRGLGVQDIDRTFNPAVQLVIDGVTYGSSIANQLLNVIDVERLEVLRGPQGTLFGSNAIGGVINIARRQPSGEFGAELKGTFGSYDRRDVEGSIEAPLVEGLLAGRIFFSRLKNDGPFKNLFDGRTRGFEDKVLITPQLRFTPTDDFEAILSFDYYRDRSDWGYAHNRSGPNDLLCLGILFFPGQPLCDDPNRNITQFNQNTPTYLEVDTRAANLRLKHVSEQFVLESISGWSRTREDKLTDFDGIPQDLFASRQPVEEVYYSQEFRLSYDHSDRLNFLGGVFGAYNDYQDGANSFHIFSLLGFPPNTTEVVDKQQRTLSFGVFLTGNWQVTDTFGISAGGRFSYEEKDFIYRNGYNQVGGGFFPDAPGFDNVAPGKKSWTQFTPRVALEYRLNPDVLLYLSYAQGFKSGGFNGRGNSLDTIGPYDPEIVDSYEAGMKSEWWDNRLRVNVAAFYSDFSDKQEEIIRTNPDTGATITTVDNAGKATMQGIEVEWLMVPLQGLSLSGSIGYLKAEYDRFEFGGFDVSDFVKMRRAPKWQYSLTGQYETHVGQAMVTGLVSYRWTDDYEPHLGPRFDGGGPSPLWNDPRGTIDAFGTLDASLSADFVVNGVNLRAMVFGRNLTDKEFLAGVAPIANLWAMGGVHPGRSWGLELSARL
jgi:iron complex outermembrane recepter protein